MQRIVDGTLYEGKTRYDAWDVRIWEQNGHREVSARPVIEWSELGPVPDLDPIDPVRDAEWLEEKRQQARRKAARRAQTMCRRVIKAEGFNELLTITYRENMQDREATKRHFKEWVRRMKRALGGEFRYCAAPELQERGSYHWHVACHKLPQHATHKGVKVAGWRLGTEIWRSIVGEDNGLVFVGGKPSKVKSRKALRSPAKMAAYVSKYILKDAENSPDEKNRYSRSNAIDVGRIQTVRLGGELADVIAAAFTLQDGEVVVSHSLNRWRDAWWLCTERDPRKSPH